MPYGGEMRARICEMPETDRGLVSPWPLGPRDQAQASPESVITYRVAYGH
jgi:hypothetical protein